MRCAGRRRSAIRVPLRCRAAASATSMTTCACVVPGHRAGLSVVRLRIGRRSRRRRRHLPGISWRTRRCVSPIFGVASDRRDGPRWRSTCSPRSHGCGPNRRRATYRPGVAPERRGVVRSRRSMRRTRRRQRRPGRRDAPNVRVGRPGSPRGRRRCALRRRATDPGRRRATQTSGAGPPLRLAHRSQQPPMSKAARDGTAQCAARGRSADRRR